MKISRTTLAVTAAILGLSLGAGFAPRQNAGGQNAPPADRTAAPDAATYEIDAVHSTALFRVQHLGAGQFYGRFNDLQGTFTVGEGENDLVFDVTIPIESVDTSNGQLDRHLKSPDFFNAKEYPVMTFLSTASRRTGPRTYDVQGELTIHGTTRPVTARMEWTGGADFGRGYRCGYEASFTVRRGEFGVMYGVKNGMVGDETRVIVSLEGVKQ